MLSRRAKRNSRIAIVARKSIVFVVSVIVDLGVDLGVDLIVVLIDD